MKKLHSFVILLIIGTVPITLFGQDNTIQDKGLQYLWKNHVNTRIVSELFSAYEFGDNRFQMIRSAVKPELQIRLGKNLRFRGIGRFYGELLDNLEPGRPGQDAVSKASKKLFIGDRMEFELREFYLDWFVGKQSTLRLGKQQIVWGETDGLKLLDVVNPQYFREFMLEEFEDSRIPLWAVKAEIPVKKLDIEMVWIPDMSYHDIPEFGAPYFPSALIPPIPHGISARLLDIDKPDRIFIDSDFGIKLSMFLNGWDLSFSYLYLYDDLPVLRRRLQLLSDNRSLFTVQPLYKRLHSVGGTFNNVIGPITLRGELAYNVKRHFMSTSIVDAVGIVLSDQFMLAIGADWLFNETMLSAQFFNDVLLKDVVAFNRKRYDINYSFLVSQELLYDDLKIELLMVQNLKEGDGMIRPKAYYYLQSNLQLIVGSDIFIGSNKGLFGQYEDRTRLFLGFEWGL